MNWIVPTTTDQELLAQAHSLGREADIVLADLSLFERLTADGRPCPNR